MQAHGTGTQSYCEYVLGATQLSSTKKARNGATRQLFVSSLTLRSLCGCHMPAASCDPLLPGWGEKKKTRTKPKQANVRQALIMGCGTSVATETLEKRAETGSDENAPLILSRSGSRFGCTNTSDGFLTDAPVALWEITLGCRDNHANGGDKNYCSSVRIMFMSQTDSLALLV